MTKKVSALEQPSVFGGKSECVGLGVAIAVTCVADVFNCESIAAVSEAVALRKADLTSQFWLAAVIHRLTSAKIVLIIEEGHTVRILVCTLLHKSRAAGIATNHGTQ